ncbi:MAG: hypothetical protein FWG87_08910 [Defluviitaleaceae bacterium]|nr:hypothetical protein [Defluviitaleaceae bacterium]
MAAVNEIISIGNGMDYFISPTHRRGSATEHKSIWCITSDDEVNCFKLSVQHGWVSDTTGWGLHIIYNNIRRLGYNLRNDDLRIAKFIDKNTSGTWHGYPADYVYNKQDCPSDNVLKDWVRKNFINKAGMLRIKQGKKGDL